MLVVTTPETEVAGRGVVRVNDFAEIPPSAAITTFEFAKFADPLAFKLMAPWENVAAPLASTLKFPVISPSLFILKPSSAKLADPPEPVSYTHLTLPTNREV